MKRLWCLCLKLCLIILFLIEIGVIEFIENKFEKKDSKKEVRVLYLMEKYGIRWREKMWKILFIYLKLI